MPHHGLLLFTMFQSVSPKCVLLLALTVSSLSFAHLSDDVCKANRSADAYHLVASKTEILLRLVFRFMCVEQSDIQEM